MSGMLGVRCCVLISAGFLSAAQAQLSSEMASTQVSLVQQTAEKVPVIDAGAGPCSVELIVTGADGKPVYAATVKVHIAYGFGGMRKLDLEAGTNSDGAMKFTGLPTHVHRPPLEYWASKDEFVGVAT